MIYVEEFCSLLFLFYLFTAENIETGTRAMQRAEKSGMCDEIEKRYVQIRDRHVANGLSIFGGEQHLSTIFANIKLIHQLVPRKDVDFVEFQRSSFA